MWLLSPFLKELQRRTREKVLMEQLHECVGQLFRNPLQPGLNLEEIDVIGSTRVLSARITQSYRLLLVAFSHSDLGLLYFANHDEAYQWERTHRATIPTMLERVQEVSRDAPAGARFTLVPAVRADAEAPIAIAAAADFTRIIDEGVDRYLSYIDDDQRRLVELSPAGLLLVKGGAGTGKTAVAIHRVLALWRQPPLLGARGVLYLCFNRALATAVRHLIRSLNGGILPEDIEIRTFHELSRQLLGPELAVEPDPLRCHQNVVRAMGKCAAQYRPGLAGIGSPFVQDEILQVIKNNGIGTLEDYLNFNRRGRGERLKRASREAIWQIKETADSLNREAGIGFWEDLPLLALQSLHGQPNHPTYRAIVIDEAQDCSPVMVRLARQLLPNSEGSLTVFADPAQTMFRNGFQWTQNELRPASGNVRWLRKTYRTTRAIYDLARPLLDGFDDLRDELENLYPPERVGTPPVIVVGARSSDVAASFSQLVASEGQQRPLSQIAILAPSNQSLNQAEAALQQLSVPHHRVTSRDLRLTDESVKLFTIQSVKGLDFPVVYVVAPTVDDFGGRAHADASETRRALYVALTRASERLVLGVVDGRYHPLIEKLNLQVAQAAGPAGREFANRLGIPFHE
jgi:hypothetical protein